MKLSFRLSLVVFVALSFLLIDLAFKMNKENEVSSANAIYGILMLVCWVWNGYEALKHFNKKTK